MYISHIPLQTGHISGTQKPPVAKFWDRLPKAAQLFTFYHITCSIFFAALTAAAPKSLQSCPTLCDPIDGSPPGSPLPGILQARTLEWVTISFSTKNTYLVLNELSKIQL